MPPKTEHKSTTATIKAAGDDGSFEAAIARFDVVDHDGDVVERGAFGSQVAHVLPAHIRESVPLGKTRVEERGNEAIAMGRFNLEIGAAKEWSSALKFDLANPPAVQEWSWGFRVPEGGAAIEERDGRQVRVLKRVELLEVSPVLRGASIGTRTIAAKCYKGAKLYDNELRERIEQAVSEVESDFDWLYVEAVDPDGKTFIYTVRVEGEPAQIFERDFTNDDGSIAIGDERREQMRRTVYEPKSDDDFVPKLADRIAIAHVGVRSLLHEIRQTANGRKGRGRKLGEDVRLSTVELAGDFAALVDELTLTIKSDVQEADEIARATARYLATEALRRGLLNQS